MLVEEPVLERVCVFVLQVGAVRLFFTPEEGQDPPSLAKRHFLQTGESGNQTKESKIKSSLHLPLSHLSPPPTDNAKESLAMMPFSKPRERLMLRALNRYGTSPEGCTQAWLSLPHSTRVFYPHAYCSRWAARTAGWFGFTVVVKRCVK